MNKISIWFRKDKVWARLNSPMEKCQECGQTEGIRFYRPDGAESLFCSCIPCLVKSPEITRIEISDEAEIKPPAKHPASYMPAPKGYQCPACRHGTGNHREHGCDIPSVDDLPACECTAPYGRIMPEDGWPERPAGRY